MTEKVQNVIWNIAEEIMSDSDDQSEELVEFYMNIDDEGRAIIDKALRYMCGWTLPTLIQRSRLSNWDY
jgi:hypothetical protein